MTPNKKPSHTPGPWMLNPGNHGEVWASKALGLDPEKKVRLAVVEGYRAFSDARLIAAAPDLLTLVKKLDDESEAYDLNTDKGRTALANSIRQLGFAARAAIACAKGA